MCVLEENLPTRAEREAGGELVFAVLSIELTVPDLLVNSEA